MIWVVGNRGMLGREVEEGLRIAGLDFIGSDKDVDITGPLSVDAPFLSPAPRWIVNCAAYTDVENAEVEQEKAFHLNAFGAGNLARLAHTIKARFIHISTDYVFDGKKSGAYSEDDPVSPVSAYGRSKAEGEARVLDACPDALIIRTAWLYGKGGRNFVSTMLRLFSEKQQVRVVDDQLGSPTFSVDLANAIRTLIEKDCGERGIMHFTNSGQTTWFRFALKIYKGAMEHNLLMPICEVLPINSSQYQTRAYRPRNSSLQCGRIERWGVLRRPWEDALDEFLRALVRDRYGR